MEYFGMKGEARRIVSFDEDKCKAFLHADRLRKIIESRPEIKNLPTIVVAIGGEARTGKSFLLNLIASYLACLEQNGKKKDWKRSSCPIRGISWARCGESITHGIWMFSHPFIVRRYNGMRAAVLLVDSQGTGDNLRSVPEIDTLITYIGLQISSVQVLNVKGYLNAKELTAMELCTDYADIDDEAPKSMKGTHQEEYLFQSLVFLIRDFDSDDHTLGEDPNLFPDLMRDCKSTGLKKTLIGIGKVFRDISCYKMPHPGKAIAKANEGQLKVRDVEKKFLKHVCGLANKLCDLEQPKGGQSQCWESATDLLNNFEMMKYHSEKDDLPAFTNPSDALQEIVMHRAFAQLQLDVGHQVEKIWQPDKLASSSAEKVKQSLDRLKKEQLEKFKVAAKYRKYEGRPIACKYLEMSEELFKLNHEKVMDRFEYLDTVRKAQEEKEKHKRQKEKQEEDHRKERQKTQEQLDDYQRRIKDMTEEQKAEAKRHMQQLYDEREKMDKRHEKNQELFITMENELQSRIDDALKQYQQSLQEKKQKLTVLSYLKNVGLGIVQGVAMGAAGGPLGAVLGGIAGIALGVAKALAE